MGADAVGRRHLIDGIAASMAAVAAGAPGAVIELVGEAGIGKSTVFEAVVADAVAHGWRVARANPTAAEAVFPWIGLAQLAGGLRPDADDPLVRDHVAHIDSVVSTTRRQPADPELVAFGLAGLLDSFRPPAAPILVAIDDAQWLDPASAGAIAYAVRGTAARRCFVLLTARLGEPMPFEPERLLRADHFTRVTLPGLSVAGLREVITAATGQSFGRGELAQIHQRTGGNPLYAVELARTVLDGVPLDAAALPASLRETIGRRVRGLPADTRRVLGAAALALHPEIGVIQAALADVDVLAALEAAETEQIARLHRDVSGSAVITFRHPLLASAAIDSLTTSARVGVASALAEVVTDPVERAGYRLADLRPDAGLAEQLELAAGEAAERGAADAAVAIAAACMTATPPGVDPLARVRRALLHAQWSINAGRLADVEGSLDAAQAVLEQHTVDTPEWNDARERWVFLGALRAPFLDDVAQAAALTEHALDHVRDHARRSRLHRQLLVMVQHSDITRGAELAEQFFGPAGEHADDPASVGVVLTARAAAGNPVDVDGALAEADRLDAERRDARLYQITELLVWTDHPRTEEVLGEVIRRLDRTGYRIGYLQDLAQLTVHRFLRGDWAAAERGFDVLAEYVHEQAQPDSTAGQLALLRAAQGRVAEAERIVAGLARRIADVVSDPTESLWVVTRTALTAHTLGKPDAADQLLAAERLAEQLRTRAVRGLNFRRDLVEALVAAGRLAEAEAACSRLATDAAHNRVPTALADADAAAGVVAAARGEFDIAARAFAAAAKVHRDYDLRYEHARTLLAAGSAARRAGARTAAREHLETALGLFQAMGAVTWVRRCSDELERIRGRRRADSSDELSASEQQVAELVAAGRSNAEIASTLFCSVRTVESHLTRTYRKLGVRSRTELAARLNATR